MFTNLHGFFVNGLLTVYARKQQTKPLGHQGEAVGFQSIDVMCFTCILMQLFIHHEKSSLENWCLAAMFRILNIYCLICFLVLQFVLCYFIQDCMQSTGNVKVVQINHAQSCQILSSVMVNLKPQFFLLLLTFACFFFSRALSQWSRSKRLPLLHCRGILQAKCELVMPSYINLQNASQCYPRLHLVKKSCCLVRFALQYTPCLSNSKRAVLSIFSIAN